MVLSVALLVPWAAGALLVAFDGRRRPVAWLGVAALAATLPVLVVLAVRVVASGPVQVVTGDWPPGIGIVLRADALGITFALVSVLVLLAAAANEAVLGPRARTFPGLLVLLAAGLTGLFLTGDLFNFYVFFEISMTASYALTAYGGEARQLRAAMIFAAVNLLGSFIFLMSVAGTYRITGALAMADVAERMPAVGANAGLLVAVGFFVAFSVKLGLFPFHFWLPTVYSGSRPAVAAVLSGAVANIGGYGLLRFGGGVCSPRSCGWRRPRSSSSVWRRSSTAVCWRPPGGTPRRRWPTPPSGRWGTCWSPWVSPARWAWQPPSSTAWSTR
jgi:multicomponent Na+:H+ antiporter subunit D